MRGVSGRRKMCAIILDELGHLYEDKKLHKKAGEYLCRASSLYKDSARFAENCKWAKDKGWLQK